MIQINSNIESYRNNTSAPSMVMFEDKFKIYTIVIIW